MKEELSPTQKRSLKRKKEGRCVHCGDENPKNSYRCEKCKNYLSNKIKQYRREREDKGLCVYCGELSMEALNQCETCWFKQFSWNALKNRSMWKKLKEKLIAQNYECVYTKEKLIPGVNAGLDHIIPVSKGGEKSIENVQWVLRKINMMKTDMDHDEFINMCKLVLSCQRI